MNCVYVWDGSGSLRRDAWDAEGGPVEAWRLLRCTCHLNEGRGQLTPLGCNADVLKCCEVYYIWCGGAVRFQLVVAWGRGKGTPCSGASGNVSNETCLTALRTPLRPSYGPFPSYPPAPTSGSLQPQTLLVQQGRDWVFAPPLPHPVCPPVAVAATLVLDSSLSTMTGKPSTSEPKAIRPTVELNMNMGSIPGASSIHRQVTVRTPHRFSGGWWHGRGAAATGAPCGACWNDRTTWHAFTALPRLPLPGLPTGAPPPPKPGSRPSLRCR
jgi:hypothetical protein